MYMYYNIYIYIILCVYIYIYTYSTNTIISILIYKYIIQSFPCLFLQISRVNVDSLTTGVVTYQVK